MFCTECGQKLNDGTKFCSNCGKPQSKENNSFFLHTGEDSIETQSAVISSDGKYLAFIKRGSEVQIIDTQSKEVVHNISRNNFSFDELLAVSSSGNLIVTRLGGFYFLWDVQKRKRYELGAGFSPRISHFAFNSESKKLAYILGLDDHDLIKIIETEEGKEVIIPISGKKYYLNLAKSLAYSSDGHYLAVLREIAPDGSIGFIWDACNGNELCKLEVKYKGEYYGSITFSHDGNRVITLLNGILTICDVRNGSVPLKIGEVINGKESGAICLSPDDRIIAAGYSNGIIRFFDAETEEPLKSLPGDTTSIEWLSYKPSGKKLIFYAGGTIQFWVSK